MNEISVTCLKCGETFYGRASLSPKSTGDGFFTWICPECGSTNRSVEYETTKGIAGADFER